MFSNFLLGGRDGITQHLRVNFIVNEDVNKSFSNFLFQIVLHCSVGDTAVWHYFLKVAV